MRVRHWVAGIAVAAGLATMPTVAMAQKSQDTLRAIWRNAIPNVDPYYNSQRTGLVVAHHVWDTLIYRDPETFQLVPQLALSWRYTDPTTLEFDLRPGVKFHDGSAFTAADVAYTVNTILADKQVAVPSNYGFYESAEAVGELQVRIKLKRVFPAALEYIAMVLPILPKEYRERVGGEFSKVPVGTGPYRITRVDGMAQLDLERNDAYFDGPKGKPPIRKLSIKQVADATTELTAIIGGQADWIWDYSSDQIENLGRLPTVQTMRQESMRVGYMNLDAAGRTGADNPLTKVKVRQAIMHAVDRGTMSRQFMPGGRVLDAPCYPSQFGCDQEAATRYEYDPAKARALLAEAGYPNGFEIEMVGYLLPQWQGAIQNYLGAVGIKARLTQLQVAAAIQRSIEGKNPLDLGSWGSYSINDASAFLPYFFAGLGQDYTRDPEVQRLVQEGGEVNDPDQRRKAYTAVFQRISEQAYFMPLYTFVTNYAVSRTLDFKAYRDELPRFYSTKWK